MRTGNIVLAALAALALIACGKKDKAGPPSASSAAASIEAASPLEKPFALKGAKDVDVDALFALMPEKNRPTYVKKSFDAKLGATIVTGLRFVDRTPENDEDDGFTIDRAEFYGVDMAAIDRAKAAEPAIDAPFEKLFEKVRLFGFKPLSTEDGSTIGAIEIDRFELRRGGFAETEEENLAAFFNTFQYAGLYFKDIAVGDTIEDGSFSLTAPDLRFVGVGGGKAAAIISRNFEYRLDQPASVTEAMAGAAGGAAGAFLTGPLKGIVAPDKQRVAVKSFEWRNIDMSGLMAYGLKKEKPPMSARNLMNFGTMRLLGAETYIDEKKAASLAEGSVSAAEFAWLLPSKIKSGSKGLVYDFTAYAAGEPKIVSILKGHGLHNVKSEADLSWDWAPDKGGASLRSSFTSDVLADMTLNADFSGLDLKKMAAASEAGEPQPVVALGVFNGFSLRIADKKLLDAMFDIYALEAGGTGAELRKSMPSMVRLSGAAAAAQSPRFGAYADAVANFIEEGGALEISARPKTPVPLKTLAASGMQDPEAFPELINLEVVHKPKTQKK